MQRERKEIKPKWQIDTNWSLQMKNLATFCVYAIFQNKKLGKEEAEPRWWRE